MAEIFISHATKTAHPKDDDNRAKAREIRERAFKKLKASGHVPILDRSCLKPNDDWSAELQRWLGQCHGAVVIVDRQGLGSNWLRHESTILSWRRSQTPGFRLITVLVGGLTSNEINDAGLGWLLTYQAIDATSDVAQTVGNIVEAFTGLEAAPDSSPLAEWVRDVAKRLKSVQGGLEDLAKCLGVKPAELRTVGDPEVTIAHTLLHAKPAAAQRALEELWRRGIDGAAFCELVRLLRPVCVDAAAAASLHRLIDAPPPQPAIINVADASLGRLYLDRARLRLQHPSHGVEIDVIAGEGGDREIEPMLREALMNRVALNKHMDNRFGMLRKEDQDEALAVHFNKPEKFFLLVGSSATHVAILRRLRSRMPAATYILLPEFDDATLCAQQQDTEMVEPRLERRTYLRLVSQLTEFDNLEGIALDAGR